MLKMIIADDERVIRETLASIVAREEEWLSEHPGEK